MDELRSQTGYARSTISEAVRLLRDRGIIEIRPGRNGGLFVAEPNPVVRLRHTLLRMNEPAVGVADAIVVRDALELVVNLDAAKHRSDSDLTELRQLLESMHSSLTDFQAFMRFNVRLHERIAAITPNELLKAVYLSTCSHVSDYQEASLDEDTEDAQGYLQSRLNVHRALVSAIEAQSPDAVYAAVLDHRGGDDMLDLPPE
ncbi:FadR/GntR family transcriptional regulator [Mycolicibacterium bacteremicum]|uniref:FadR/GntR family transcriptional regulator n=1 Tax=Mycolicibacterium bacteremicum TaxID=564198 RepID=UPI00350E5AD1